MCHRGTNSDGDVIIWYNGLTYDMSQSPLIVSDHTLEKWIEGGVCEFVDGPEKEVVKPKPTPKPKEEPEVVVEPLDGVISVDLGTFPCPHKKCDRNSNPYSEWYHFRKHMEVEHTEKWVLEDGKVFKVGG